MASLALIASASLSIASIAPLPPFFAESWAAITEAPLLAFVPSQGKSSRLPVRALVASDPDEAGLTLATKGDRMPVLPALITTGEATPQPPEKPVLRPALAAYASLTPGLAMSDAPVVDMPMPVQRPADLAVLPESVEPPKVEPPAKPTRVAMLGAPLAGTAIGNLVKMAATDPVGTGACHVEKPFKVFAAGPSSMDLEPAATVNAAMAERLGKWATDVEAAARQHMGQKIETIMIAGSYDCRTRNHIRRARLSEHSFANAIDVAGFRFANGETVTIKSDWRGSGPKTAFLKAVHQDTCDLFQVVLGPGSDGYHEEHLHMDLGRWKSCR